MILSVNIDHIATIRQARLGDEPDTVMAANLALLGGADGITLHVREDRRHVNERDLRMLRSVIPVGLNLEMAATDAMIDLALEVRPDMITLVPEKREELTTEGGLDLVSQAEVLSVAIDRFDEAQIPVSLFINPSIDDVKKSYEIGARMVEIHTGLYANARGKEVAAELSRVKNAVKNAVAAGMTANAGHGINYRNIKGIAEIKAISGLYIGHGIISRAVMIGMREAVSQMKAAMEAA